MNSKPKIYIFYLDDLPEKGICIGAHVELSIAHFISMTYFRSTIVAIGLLICLPFFAGAQSQTERPPVVRSHPAVDYPAASRRFEEEGVATVRIRVLPDGAIDSVSVVQTSGYPRLDDVAVKYAQSLQIAPGIDARGQPVAADIDLPVEFRLTPPVPARDPRVQGSIGVEVAPQGWSGTFVIKKVAPGSPAERAGLLSGDMVVAVNDWPATGVDDFFFALARTRPGEPIALTFNRKGSRIRQYVYAEGVPR